MTRCDRWERLYQQALQSGNKEKALEFKEKIVECVVYSLWNLVKEKELREAEPLIKYGYEIAEKYEIPELKFHLGLIQEEIERIREIYRRLGRGEKV
ncbi:MAG: hypothetical protein GXO23_02860 [Crenarchaeota archaeon]|nr:hypothetical protein [Thermoproteota archaeon]